MNKRRIDAAIPIAYRALKDTGIADEKDSISKTFAGQIASFGTAVMMGSLLSAVAFFSMQSGSDVERPRLMEAIFQILKQDERNVIPDDCERLYDYAEKGVRHIEKERGEDGEETEKIVEGCGADEIRENILNAAVALKLAMNLYDLVDQKKKDPDHEKKTGADR